jgi:hypothetical protein
MGICLEKYLPNTLLTSHIYLGYDIEYERNDDHEIGCNLT